jgi:hypothetical protein
MEITSCYLETGCVVVFTSIRLQNRQYHLLMRIDLTLTAWIVVSYHGAKA